MSSMTEKQEIQDKNVQKTEKPLSFCLKATGPMGYSACCVFFVKG